MKEFFIGAFVVISLFIRVPIRIAKRVYNVENDKLDIADLIATIVSALCLVGLCISAVFSGEVDTGSAVIFSLLIGGIALLLGGAWIYIKIKKRNEYK